MKAFLSIAISHNQSFFHINNKGVIEMKKENENLSCLNPGECAVIKSLENSGTIRRRLMDLGFAEGSKAICLGVAPFGDPKAYLIKNTIIALREEDSSLIKTERIME